MSRDDTLKNNHCKCDKLNHFKHELAQSLMIINTYINGCQQRIKFNTLTHEQLLVIFDKIKMQTEIISTMSERLLAKNSRPID
ncbi:hypothetical protein DIZ81_11730 [Legionella taurinensis]|uniref:Uncharacterized protein n=1 Tax=Legionella taurinensis TaxID=70611 RepID=A0A3A5L2H3_9GAMM|nr:hypothetical protein [Legionella taurinensis]MDX1838630.1 hypothetical protein [Legionella taurinensis]PUT39066.1 hypothetical protein DB744_11740 [Legionella taurinensis]PUT41152.1 hypothetical protein DB746_10130 [Legionella taurinensis]PUT43527.1 hypothetical protein DB743_11135 [Legionella taurinensis]PUT46544.1 hypothetical protein DB745_10620 [Legionella taurinensis]